MLNKIQGDKGMDSYIINDINIDVFKKQKRQKEDENKPLSRLLQQNGKAGEG